MLDSRDQEAPVRPFLKLTAVRKTYPGVVALAGFDMVVAPGEVIGLVGENGAGKSTLMKVLGGVTAPDSGTIDIDGAPYAGLSVGGSMKLCRIATAFLPLLASASEPNEDSFVTAVGFAPLSVKR